MNWHNGCADLERGGFRLLAGGGSLAPEYQGDLLSSAECDALEEFRRKCARVRASSGSEAERRLRVHKNRQLRHWTDIEGAFRLDGRLTPEAGAVVMACLEPFRQQVARRAAQHGLKQSPAALDADALVEMADRARCTPMDVFRSAPAAMVQIRIDHSALERGHTVGAEVCEVPGVGPIPVAAAKALMSDAILNAVVTKGQDIVAVAHMGRTVTAVQRTALWERDQGCVVPGCNDRSRVEIDHIHEHSLGGPTALHNLALLCSHHHGLKTHHGWRLRRLKGQWLFEEPHGPPPDRDAGQPELVAAR